MLERIRMWWEPPDVFVNAGRIYRLVKTGKRSFDKTKKDMLEAVEAGEIPDGLYAAVYAISNSQPWPKTKWNYRFRRFKSIEDFMLAKIHRRHPYALYEKLL